VTHAPITIEDAFALFRLTGPSWLFWRAVVKATFGRPLAAEERAVFERFAKRKAPSKAVRQAWYAIGRRGGKSRVAAFILSVLALRDYSALLAPGEVATVMCLCVTRKQARTVLRYVKGFLSSVPALEGMIVASTRESITLSNGVVIEVHTSSFRSIRGYTVVAAVLDEICLWPADEDSAEPDREIVNALLPSMLTIPEAVLVGIGNPYAEKGVMFEAVKEHYGKESEDVLVVLADTLSGNPRANASLIERAFGEDDTAAWSEYGRDGEIRFRSDVATFVPPAVIEACVAPGVLELPSQPDVAYYGFVDPSGLVNDSMTAAVAHVEELRLVLDAVREVKPPGDPEAVVRDFAELFKSFGISSVTGDRYSGTWCSSSFEKAGITYVPSERNKSQIYLAALPLLTSKRAVLLDVKRLRSQITGLERRTARGGHDSVDHRAGGRDDLANAALGALVLAASQRAFVFELGPHASGQGFTVAKDPQKPFGDYEGEALVSVSMEAEPLDDGNAPGTSIEWAITRSTPKLPRNDWKKFGW
jgi:hypothetical protein